MTRVEEEAVRFDVDGLTLEGRLALPPAPQRAVVLCHPHPQYGGTMDNNVILALADRLVDAGAATLRFNFRGVGASEGRYGGGKGEANDAKAAVACLRQRLAAAEITLVGYSFGAIVALLAGHDDDVARLVAVAPPVTMFDTTFLNGCTKPKLFVIGERDQYCPIAALQERMADFTGPKRLVRVEHADHFFFGHEQEVARAAVDFIGGNHTA